MIMGNAAVRHALESSEGIAFSPVVLGELKSGFLKGARRRQNEENLRRFLDVTDAEILRIDGDTSECYAEILDSLRRAGTPIPTNDIWIAASAMQYGLRVITSDEHFRLIPQILVDFYQVERS